jgi:YVTN family beta-propeller protein
MCNHPPVRRRSIATAAALSLLLVAPAWADKFVAYKTNSLDSTISQFKVRHDGALAPLHPPTVPTSSGPGDAVVSPDGASLYVTRGGVCCDGIRQYDIGRKGRLTPKDPVAVYADSPSGLAFSPDGRRAYVTNSSWGVVSHYDVGPDGELTRSSLPDVEAGWAAGEIAITRDGRHVYVANYLGSTISQYDVAPNGALIPKTPASVPADDSLADLVISPDGRSVYAVSIITERVYQFTIGSDGGLVPKSPAFAAAGYGAIHIALTPDGTSAYVTNQHDDTVSQFDVAADGRLSSKTPAAVPAGDTPYGIAVSPDGSSVYATNINSNTANPTVSVVQFDVGPGGLLTPKRRPTVAGPPSAADIVVTPLPR